MSGYMHPLSPPLSDGGSLNVYICEMCNKQYDDRASYKRHQNQHEIFLCPCGRTVSGRVDVLRRHWKTKACTYSGQRVEDAKWFPAGTAPQDVGNFILQMDPQYPPTQRQGARPITPPLSDDGSDKGQPGLLVNSPGFYYAPATSFSGNREYLQMHPSGRSYAVRDEMPHVNVFKQGSVYAHAHEGQDPTTVAPYHLSSF